MAMEKLSLAAFQEAIESGLKGCHVHCLGLVACSLSCWLDELAKKKKRNSLTICCQVHQGIRKPAGYYKNICFLIN